MKARELMQQAQDAPDRPIPQGAKVQLNLDADTIRLVVKAGRAKRPQQSRNAYIRNAISRALEQDGVL